MKRITKTFDYDAMGRVVKETTLVEELRTPALDSGVVVNVDTERFSPKVAAGITAAIRKRERGL